MALHRFTVLLALAAGAFAVAFNALAASDAAGGYRLAGIIAAGKDHVGLLELPQGGQVLVRVGSSLPDGARVLSLTDRDLALQLPGGRRLQLVLSGLAGGSAVSATRGAEAAAAPEIVKTSIREPTYSVLTVSLAPFREALRAPAAGDTTPTKPSDAVVMQRFSSLLALPPGARILAVNDKPVASAAAVVSLIDRALAQGLMAVLNVQSNSDRAVQRIYLRPEQTRP